MSALVLAICLLLDFGFWLLLFVFSVSVYKTYRLRTLPWLGAYAFVSLITFPLRQHLTGRFLDSSKVQPLYYGQFPTTPETTTVYFAWFLISFSEVCALVLVLSEIATLLRRSFPGTESAIVRLFCAAHTRVRLIGAAAVASSLLSPLPALIYLWVR